AHISLQGRPTQGVILMDVGGDAVAAVAVIDMQRGYTEPQALPTGATVKSKEPGQKGKARAAARGPGAKKPGAKPSRPAKAPKQTKAPPDAKGGRQKR
ncbi:MAG: hypothetical protein HYY03_07695, partial [Chloroflexi bacterium]|nr:hypothetical protein [Chloroflexota bacterium]